MGSNIGFLSRRPGLIRAFTMIFSIVMLLCTGSCLLQWNIQENRTASLESWYGKWQAMVTDPSISDRNRLETSEVLSQTGTVVTGTDETGAGDTDFFDLANLTLKAGHLPESENEVAVESAWLDEHGLSYELNQTIEAGGKSRILTGILDPYRSTWTAGDRLPALWIVTIDHPESELLYLKAKSGYEDFFDQVRTDGILVKNVNLEGSWDPVSEQTLPYTILGLFFLTVSIVMTVLAGDYCLKRYRRSIAILKFLGADSTMLITDAAWLYFKTSLLPVIILVAVWLILRFPVWLAAVIFGIYILILIVSLILTFPLIRQIPAVTETPSEKETIPHHLPGPMKRISVSELAWRHLRWDVSGILIPILAVTLSAGLSASMLAWTMDAERYAKTVKLDPDFTLYSDMPGLGIAETDSLIPESTLYKIRTMKGVDQIFTFYLSWLWDLSWVTMQTESVIRNIPNLDQADGQLISKTEEGFRLRPVLCELSDTPLAATVMSESGVDPDRFAAGEEIILYLPDFTARLDGTGAESYELYDPESENPGLEETSLQKGDQVILTNSVTKEIRTVTVGGILRTPLNADSDSADRRSKITQAFATPYTVIVSPGFLNHTMINTAEIWLSEDRMPITETNLSVLARQDHLNFQNDSARNGQLIQYFRNEKLLFLILAVLSFFAMIVAAFWNAYREIRSEKTWLEQLKICDPQEKKLKEVLRRYRDLRFGILILCLALSIGFAWILQSLWIPGLSILRQGCSILFDTDLNPTGVIMIIRQSAWVAILITALATTVICILLDWIGRKQGTGNKKH